MDAAPTHPVARTWPLRQLAHYGDAALGLFDQAIVSVANFLTIVLLARAMPIEAFGIFMVAHTVLLLLTGLQNALVAQPHNILGAQRTGESYAALTTTLAGLQLIVCFVFSLLALGAGAVWSALDKAQYAHAAWALALVVPAWMGQEFIRRVLYTEGDISGAAINNTISYGLQVAGIAWLMTSPFGFRFVPPNALFVLGASSLIACLAGIAYRNRLLLRRTRGSLFTRKCDFAITTKETWRLSKWLVAQQGAAWLGASGHGLLLTAFLGPAAFGAYRAAYQVVNVLNPLRQAASNHLPSRAARVATRGVRDLARWNKKVTLTLALPFTLCAFAIVFIAEPLSRLMYGSADLPDLQTIVALGALSYSLNFFRTPLDYSLLVAGAARALFVRTLWLDAFVLTIGVLLIVQFGVFGVLISELVVAVLAGLLALRLASTFFRNSPMSPMSPVSPVTQQAGDLLA